MNMDENKRRRSMLLYILIAIVVYLAVSQTMYPALQNSQTKEVSYSEFLTMVDKKEVTQVQKTQGDATLYFTTGEGDGQQKYSTVIFGSGEGLTEKLEASGAQMVGKIADTSNDMWIYLLISYGLPIIVFFILGWYLNRRMKKAMGDDGPSMNFGGGFGMGGGLGKSNVKEVKGEETGVSFKDVAGQDEAKESLEEIVELPQKARQVQRDRRPLPARRAARRPSGHRQDPSCQGGRRRGWCALLPDRRLRVRRDVRRPRRREGARPFQAGQGEGPLHHLHRRDRRRGQEARRIHQLQ